MRRNNQFALCSEGRLPAGRPAPQKVPTAEFENIENEKSGNGNLSNHEYLNSSTSPTVAASAIFPRVLSNYESDVLELSDPSNFRDLSRPLGTVEAARLQRLQRRLRAIVSTIQIRRSLSIIWPGWNRLRRSTSTSTAINSN
jgi:hypothetical protein